MAFVKHRQIAVDTYNKSFVALLEFSFGFFQFHRFSFFLPLFLVFLCFIFCFYFGFYKLKQQNNIRITKNNTAPRHNVAQHRQKSLCVVGLNVAS